MMYLDHCATTAVYPEVQKVMMEAMETSYANPSSLHRQGMQMEKRLKEAREQMGRILGLPAKGITFTSGATEGNNTVIRGLVERDKGRHKKIIASPLEHASISQCLQWAKDSDYEIALVEVEPSGVISLDSLNALLDEETLLVCLTLVQSEIGTVQPLEDIERIVHGVSPSIHLHVDAVQAVGKMDLPSWRGVDSLVLSGHKFHGPKGTGVLYLRDGVRVNPLIYGGGQEGGFRSGTENVPGILGMAKALELVEERRTQRGEELERAREILLSRLYAADLGMRVNGEGTVPSILSVSFPSTRGEVLLHMLEDKDIYVSTASACSSHKKTKKNPVLAALGVPETLAEGTLRLCLGEEFSVEEAEVLAKELIDVVKDVQEIIGR